MPTRQFACLIVLLLSVLPLRNAFGQEETDLTVRIEQLERENESLRRQVDSLRAIALRNSKQYWVDRLLSLENHNQTAFFYGPGLVLIDPETALAAVQEVWPRLEKQDVKTGILKAFAFGKPLRPKKHPEVVKVLHLGMTDPDPDVRRYAAVYLLEYAKEDFKDRPEDYAEWYRKYGEEPAEAVIRLNNARVPESLKEKLGKLTEAFRAGDMNTVSKLAGEIGELKHPYAIPTLIGVIDADNSYETVYGVGYVGLRRITDVSYSPFHDGAWWRRWWQKNKHKYPREVAKLSIPKLPRTAYGKQYQPFPVTIDSFQGKVRYLQQILSGEGRVSLSNWAEEVAGHENPAAIPLMIGIIAADDTYDTVYGVGYFGLSKLTGVKYDESHDGAWWRNWWQENKHKYPQDVQAVPIPDFSKQIESWKNAQKEQRKQAAPAPGADVPAEDLLVDDNGRMRYFRIGPRKNAAVPEDGYKLIVILPGGDGSEQFHPFVRRLYQNSFGDDYLAVQPVAFKWNEQQKIVWPTRANPVEGQEFSTEEFVESVIKDVSKTYPIDKDFIFTLSWSSSGPAAYALSVKEDTPVTGSYIAMSVFKPDTVQPLKNVAGHAYFLDHSPQDRVCPFRMAQLADAVLRKQGAAVELNTYQGGHGWHGDVYGRVTKGIQWLEKQCVK